MADSRVETAGPSSSPATEVMTAQSEAAQSEGKPDKVKQARRPPQRLSSVGTAVRLLKCFSEGDAELGVTSLSRKLGVAKSTVYRLASTLVAEGMLEQNKENEKYRLGIALFGLGALVRQRMNISNEARPHIFALRDATNETVHLALLDGDEVIYVYDLESTQAIRMRANLGERKPAFCSSEGRAMLAFEPTATVEAILGRGLLPRTPKTDTDPERLRRALAHIRKTGYAVEDEQCEVGMRSMAAPVRNAEGRVVAAIGIAGPQQRMSDAMLERFLPLLVETAATISARLGHRAPAIY